MLRCTRYSCPGPGVFHFNSLLYYSNLYFLASPDTTAVYLDPSRSMTTYYNQQIPTHSPFFLSVASQRSRSDHVAMYYATMFCIFLMYVSIVSTPCLCPRCLRQGVLPLPVFLTPREMPRKSPLLPVLEKPQYPFHSGGKHPRLLTKEQH